MKTPSIPFRGAILWLLLTPAFLRAQNLPPRPPNLENAAEYLTAVANAQIGMNQKYMAYLSTAAHERKASRIDRMRKEAIAAISDAYHKTGQFPAFKGDRGLVQASLDYIEFCTTVFTTDVDDVLKLETTADESVDAMQAYYAQREKVEQKLQDASRRIREAQNGFAAKYGVGFVDTKSDLEDKIDATARLNRYADKLFELYFACNFYDNQMTRALNDKKGGKADTARVNLLHAADAGLAFLQSDSVRTYRGNEALANSCVQIMEFYRRTATEDAVTLIAFGKKEEAFAELKKKMEATPAADRTREDVTAYNESVRQINDQIHTYNITFDNLGANRQHARQRWEDALAAFKDDKMPIYK